MDQKTVENLFQQLTEKVSVGESLSGFGSGEEQYVIKRKYIKNEARVFDQALRHNIWLESIDIIRDKFPNESDKINEYRNKNIRQFTKEVPRKIIAGIIDVISQITIKVVSNNPKVNTWLNSKPFFFNSSYYDFNTWALGEVIPKALIDPNAILLPIPIFKGATSVIGLTPKIVPHDKKYVDPKGQYLIVIDNEAKGYYFIDKEMYWYVGMSDTTPQWIPIYQHNIGELPFEYMPGNWSFDKDTRSTYYESIISPAYELLDETLMALTSAQATRLKMNSIMVRQGIKCGECHGASIVQYNEKDGYVPCKSCAGTGKAVKKKVGEHEELVIDPTDITNPDGKIIQPYFLNPEVAVALFWEKTYQDLFIQAKKSIGIDALIDQSESGEAMKKRLGTFEQFMSNLIYIVYKKSLTKFLELCQKLLEKNPSDWNDPPQIMTPKRVEIKTPEILKDNFDKAVGTERIQAAKEYYAAKYEDDPIMARTMKILVNYYPASVENNAEATNLYSIRDVLKSRYAAFEIQSIIENLGTKEKTDEQIYTEAEEKLNLKFPDSIATFDNSGNPQ